jgi:homoserine O-acetyltransferase/O-succinyltransferase
MMDALLPIASLPERVGGRNLLWRRLLIKIIQLGEDDCPGASTQQPPSLGLAWNLFELVVDSPARLTTAFAGPGDADNHIQSVAEEALKVGKANDVIWEFDASRDYDPSAGVYRKLKSDYNGDEVRQGWRVNEWHRCAVPSERRAHPCSKTDAF